MRGKRSSCGITLPISHVQGTVMPSWPDEGSLDSAELQSAKFGLILYKGNSPVFFSEVFGYSFSVFVLLPFSSSVLFSHFSGFMNCFCFLQNMILLSQALDHFLIFFFFFIIFFSHLYLVSLQLKHQMALSDHPLFGGKFQLVSRWGLKTPIADCLD